MPNLARVLAFVACLVPFALPAAAEAELDLGHVGVQAVPIGGDGDDVVNHGDAFQLTETLSTATPLANATGKIVTPTPGVNLDTDTAPFSSAPAGGQSHNTKPFEAALASDTPCGANLSFAVAVAATGGQGSVSFTVPTGAEAQAEQFDGGAGALADATGAGPGVTNLPLNIPGEARLKRMEVRIASLTHPDLSDLEIALVAPDGHVVVLAAAGTLSGTTMTDTDFVDGGLPYTGSFAPYTGTFAPRDSLASFVGRSLNGTWTLRVTDTVPGDAGTVAGWRLNAARAACVGIPRAAFTTTPSPALPGETVQFDASDSVDPNGTIETYEWDLDGDGEYDDATGKTASRTYASKGSYMIRLRITDSDHLVDVEQQRLPVTSKPVAMLKVTPVSPQTGDTVRLDAAGSHDTDGSVVAYKWALDGGAPELDSQGVDHIDVTFDKPKTYTVTVWAIDDDGAEDTEQVDVVVRNRPPVAAVTPPVLPLKDRTTTLSASGSSDPDGTIDWYEWDLDDDGTYEEGPVAQNTVDHVFATAGTHTVRLRVTDDKGAKTTTSLSFLVTRAPAVVLSATPNPVSLRRDVVLDASASTDPDGAGALTFRWDLENDGTYEAAGPPTRTTSWPTAGTRTVKVLVTDASGATTVGSVPVVVRNMLPVASLTAAPTAPKVGEVTQLSAVAADPDGVIKRFQWDRDGDGSYELDTGTTPTAPASFANPGTVTVGVRVTDDDGGTGTKTLALNIAALDAGDGGDTGGTGGTGDTTTPGGGTTPPGTTPSDPQPGDGETPMQPAGGPDGLPLDPARPFGAWLDGKAIQRTARVVAKGLVVSCRSEVAVWCALTATIARRDAKRLKLGRKDVRVASTAVPVAEGASATARLKLSAKVRRALRGKGGVRVLVRAVARTADGREVALSRVVLLRR